MQKEDKMKEERFKKVDDDVWDKVVQRMKEKERKQMENKKSRTDKEPAHRGLIEALEKRVETLEKKHQDLIENLRIFMVNDDDKEEEHE
jgi:predicted AAA+ superfamily ATPase